MDDDLTAGAGPAATSAEVSLHHRATGLLAARDLPPAELLAHADTLVKDARRDLAARAMGHRAATFALVELGQGAHALRRARRSVADARSAGDVNVLSGCLTTTAAVSFLQGGRQLAFDLLDEALVTARRTGQWAIEFDALAQRSWMLYQSGRWRDALSGIDDLLDHYRHATASTVDLADVDADVLSRRAELLADRASILAALGRFDEALAAFDVALDELRRWPGPLDIGEVRRNRAVCLTHAGRVPAAMQAFAEIDDSLAGSPALRLRHLTAHADLLLDARLLDEALVVTAEAVAIDHRDAGGTMRAEAHLLRARALRDSGDLAGARRAAQVAERRYSRLGVTGRAALARLMVAQGAPVRRRALALEAVAGELAEAGLGDEAVAARVAALTAAVAVGQREVAERQFQTISERKTGPALTRARGRLGEATWSAFIGDAPAARRAVAAGLDILDEHRASLGGTELRAHASGLGEELAAIGLGIALGHGTAGDVLRMSERWRSGVVRRRPSSSGEIAEAMADLRSLLIQAGDAGLPTEAREPLDRRRVELERRVRLLAGQMGGQQGGQMGGQMGGGNDQLSRPVGADELRTVLGQSVLVEIVEHAGRYYAVVIGPRPTVAELCAVGAPAAEARELLFALRRLARRGVSTGAARVARDGAEMALGALDALLIDPIRSMIGTGSLVIVPPGPLHAVPWPALPSLQDRVVTVAPSATWWATGGSADPSSVSDFGKVILAAGPRLHAADTEIDALATVYDSPTVLKGTDASGERFLGALDGADLVHVACHSRLRADHPHLSALELSDGPFTVYDFERLHQAPRRVVLSACESGVSAIRPGEELLGFISALLSLGTTDVLASVVPVPDLATSGFMIEFHRQLLTGSFAEALRATRRQILATSDDPADFVVATAFVAFSAAQPSRPHP